MSNIPLEQLSPMATHTAPPIAKLQPPEIQKKNGYPLYYQIYLHVLALLVRRLISFLVTDKGGYDYEAQVSTPGYGSGSCKVRVFLPSSISRINSGVSRVPLVINLEGGGFCSGSPKMGTLPCRYLADSLDAVVVSIDYAKSPTYPWPHALLQIPTVIAWATTSMPFVSIDKVAVGGISAGGCLAASFSLLATCSGETSLSMEHPLQLLPKDFRLRSQYLLCASLNPSEHYTKRLLAVPPGAARQKSLPGFLASAMEDMYLPPPIDRNSPLVSPWAASKELIHLAVQRQKFPQSAIVITAELDSLKLEGAAYANKLEHCGVDVVYKEWPGMTHGFTQEWKNKGGADRPEESEAVKAWTMVIATLNNAFNA